MPSGAIRPIGMAPFSYESLGENDDSTKRAIIPEVERRLSDFYRFLPIFRTFLGDFNPQKLPSRRLQTLWEWKNRVLLEEYYIFNVAIPRKDEFGQNRQHTLGRQQAATGDSTPRVREDPLGTPPPSLL